MTTYTSNLRYIKRYVKTTYVDIWASGEWETAKRLAVWKLFNAHGDIIDEIKIALAMTGKRRVWFMNVYLIFDQIAVDKSGDICVRGVMTESDFLTRSLASSLPPIRYVPSVKELSTAFIYKMCKKHIKIF